MSDKFFRFFFTVVTVLAVVISIAFIWAVIEVVSALTD